MDAGAENGECKALEVNSPAQHPPGGHWDVMVGIGGLPPAVGAPQELLVLLEDLFGGTDSIK